MGTTKEKCGMFLGEKEGYGVYHGLCWYHSYTGYKREMINRKRLKNNALKKWR